MTELFTFIAIIVAIVAVVRATSAKNELTDLRREFASLRAMFDALRRDFRSQPEHAAAAEPAPEPVPEPGPAFVETPPLSVEPVSPEPAFAAAEATPPEPAGSYAFAPPSVDQLGEAPPPVEEPMEIPAAAAPPPPPPPPVIEPKAAFDWESLVGVKLFSWIAGIALVLAAIFFLRDAIQRGLITPPIRMAIGVIVGAALLVVSELRIAARYRITANAMDGAGLAILYATLFASHQLWHLIPSLAAFVLMIAVTALAVFLSLRRDSVFIALLGLVGGFATPALLSTGEDRPVSLFSYLLVLNIGLAWISIRKNWPALTLLTVAFTAFYQWAWVVRFLSDSKLPLAYAVFLVFPLVAVFAFIVRREPPLRGFFNATTLSSLAMPLLFALYVAINPQLAKNTGLLFGFMFCIVVGLAVISAFRNSSAFLHQIGAASTVLVFIAWMSQNYSVEAWPKIALWATLFTLILHFAPLVARLGDRPLPFDVGRNGAVAGSLLLFVFPVLAGIEPLTKSPLVLFALLFVTVLSAAICAFFHRLWAMYVVTAIGAAITLLVWTIQHANGDVFTAIVTTLSASTLLVVAPAVVALRRKLSFKPLYFALAGPVVAFVIQGEAPRALSGFEFSLLTFWLLVLIGAAAFVSREVPLLLAIVILTSLGISAWASEGIGAASLVAQLAAVAIAAALVLAADRRFENEETKKDFATGTVVATLFALAGVCVTIGSENPPSLVFIAVAELVLLGALYAVTRWKSWHVVELVAILPVVLSWYLVRDEMPGTAGHWSRLLFAAVLYLPFVLNPLTLGERSKEALEPYLSAALAGGAFLVFGRSWFYAANLEHVIAILPLAQAAIMGVLVLHLLRLEPAGERNRGRLAMVAGVALGFVTVAIPMQLENEWITIAWALEAAALGWLNRRVPHKGLLIAIGGLGAAVFTRLALNPAVLEYHPREATPIVNWFLYTYAVPAIALYTAAWYTREEKRLASSLRAAATLLLFLLVNIEVADFYSTGEALTFNFTASLAEDLTYTIAWGLFAIAVLVAGIVLHNKPARISALALLVITIFKAFLHDLGRLGGLYRVASFVGLAICLGLVAILLQRFVLGKNVAPPPNVAPQA